MFVRRIKGNNIMIKTLKKQEMIGVSGGACDCTCKCDGSFNITAGHTRNVDACFFKCISVVNDNLDKGICSNEWDVMSSKCTYPTWGYIVGGALCILGFGALAYYKYIKK